MRANLIIVIVLLFTINSEAQKNHETKFCFKIEQTFMPGISPKYSYEVRNDKVVVYKKPVILRFYLPIKFRKQKDKINVNDYERLLAIVQSISKKEYNETYSGDVLDGVSWSIEVKYLNEIKSTILFNTSLPEFEEIISILNSNLKSKRAIRFDYFK